MRHAKRLGKLGRTSAHRKALMRNLVTALLDHERIQTTHAKARELKRVADKMITLGKRGDLHARRRALRVIQDKDVTAKVFGDLAERFRERPGGYTRVVRLGPRVGDAAPLSVVQLLQGVDDGAGKESKPAPKRRLRRRAEAEGEAKDKPARGSRKKRSEPGEAKSRGRKGSEPKTKGRSGTAKPRRSSHTRKAD